MRLRRLTKDELLWLAAAFFCVAVFIGGGLLAAAATSFPG